MHAICLDLEHIDTRNTRRDTILCGCYRYCRRYYLFTVLRMVFECRHLCATVTTNYSIQIISVNRRKLNIISKSNFLFGSELSAICVRRHTHKHSLSTICVCPRLSLIDSNINTHMHVPPHHTHTSTTMAWHGMAFGELFLISQIILFRINLIDAHTGTHAQSTYVCVCVPQHIRLWDRHVYGYERVYSIPF